MAAIGMSAPATGVERRLWHGAAVYMVALGVLFYMTYGAANWVTSQRALVPSIVFNWEHHIPFLAWTIVPYWSIDLFYCLSFFVCRTRTELCQHAKSLLAAQIVSVSAFLLLPLRFTFERPETPGVIGSMFHALASFDGPFNQAPSLHVSLAVILAARYSAHLSGIPRWMLRAWFVLIGASALTTYQHHFIDVPTGIWVGALCCVLYPDEPEARLRELPSNGNLKLSGLYLAGSVLLGTLATEIGSWALWFLWPAGACLMVSGIYCAGKPLFRKRNGSLLGPMQWLLAPYTAVAWMNSRWWTRNDPAAIEVIDGVWIGRVPSRSERELLGISSIVDMTAELPLNVEQIEYRNVPVLDLTAPDPAQLDRAVAAIEELTANRPTLVCCALGHSRSAAAVAAWLLATHRVSSIDQAVELIRSRKRITLTAAHRAALQAWTGGLEQPADSIRSSVFSRIVASTLVALARAMTGANSRWLGSAPSDKQRIYVANHTSHADFIVIWAALPRLLRSCTLAVAAADYWQKGKVRRYLSESVFRAVLVERERIDRVHNPLTPLIRALDSGNSLILFPEGTRGGGEGLQPLRCGIYHLALARPDVELIPVWIDNLHRVLPKGAMVPAPLECSVTFGEPTRLLPGESKQAFLERLHQTMTSLGQLCATSCC